MESNILMALQLMTVGMITVFIILLIVINLGKGLILLVNKIAPEEVVASSKKSADTSFVIDSTTQAVINATVDKLTNGKGKVKSVKKI